MRVRDCRDAQCDLKIVWMGEDLGWGHVVFPGDRIDGDHHARPKPIVTNLPPAYLRKSVRPIRVVQTGKVYPTIMECAIDINGNQSTISACLRGSRRKTHRGYTFEYAD